MPRLTCAGATTLGLPSASAYETFWLGNTLSVCTIAQPMRWVNETLPPRARRRWLLMTMRLSIISLAGTVRTLVAVGMLRLASMLAARVLLTPRRGVTTSSAGAASWPSTTGMPEVCGASAGIGCGLAGAEVVRATGVDAVVGAGSRAAPASACRPRAPRRRGLRRRVRAPPQRGAGASGSIDRDRRGRRRVGDRVVALQNRPPALVDRVLVDEVPLVQLVDEPFVGAELARIRVVRCGSGDGARHGLTAHSQFSISGCDGVACRWSHPGQA